MILSIIVAASENNVIGGHNAILWRLPDDLMRLKERTKGHPIIMGRKTYDSIGRALPDRMNIVVTRQADREFPGCTVAHSLEEGIRIAKESGAPEGFIFGGGELYRQAMPLADRIYMTRVHATYDGDAFFPEIAESEWKVVSSEIHEADERHAHAFTFLTYERVRNGQ